MTHLLRRAAAAFPDRLEGRVSGIGREDVTMTGDRTMLVTSKMGCLK